MKLNLCASMLFGLSAAAWLTACAEVDRTGVQAQAGAPQAAQVPIVQIPYDANLPRFVVVVEPFAYGASGIISGSGAASASQANGSLIAPITGGLQGGSLQGNAVSSQGGPGSQVGAGLAAQLTTALSNWPNVSIVDASAVQRRSDGTYSCRLNPGEVGPFIVRGTVTEFNETADLSEKKRGGSLGMAGAAAGIAGAVTGHQGLAWTGAGVAAANPTYENQKVTRKGMVGMDVQVMDGRTGRLVRGFNSSGTFTTMSATSGISIFGIGGGNAEFAASALGQATRAAMNDSVTKTSQVLATAPR
ncbi:hypothetical protein HYR69_08545 [Candidatus Sumerlaeota bacterium]|nr:hypothetical protein [Candidatus Sumerlaeota bacterium]